jgi:hypothetical protein
MLGLLALLCALCEAASIIDVLRTDPQLTSFASLIAGTSGGISNPGIVPWSAKVNAERRRYRGSLRWKRNGEWLYVVCANECSISP